MPKYSYDHVHLVSADPMKAADFYVRAFGAKKVSETPSPTGTSVALSIEGTRLLIRPPRDNKSKEDAPRTRRGLEHFGLRTDDIQGAVADLKAKGVKILDEIHVVPSSGSTVAFLAAPDNVEIELVQPAK
jgi:catechol 2,3-dioxygenase-like lactoylglutathione lyase family enzyme